jgi:hypothetical protein
VVARTTTVPTPIVTFTWSVTITPNPVVALAAVLAVAIISRSIDADPPHAGTTATEFLDTRTYTEFLDTRVYTVYQ